MLAVVLALAMVNCQLRAADAPYPIDRTQAAYRMPVGLVWQQDRLFAANARTGSVSMIDVNAGGVLAEWKVADSFERNDGMAGRISGAGQSPASHPASGSAS